MDNYIIYAIVALVIIGLIVLIWYLLKVIKRNKKQKQGIPPEILKDFETAEKRFAEAKGEKTPNQILWEIYKDKINYNSPVPEEKIYKPTGGNPWQKFLKK